MNFRTPNVYVISRIKTSNDTCESEIRKVNNDEWDTENSIADWFSGAEGISYSRSVQKCSSDVLFGCRCFKHRFCGPHITALYL